jgi:predicted transcriptional regulator
VAGYLHKTKQDPGPEMPLIKHQLEEIRTILEILHEQPSGITKTVTAAAKKDISFGQTVRIFRFLNAERYTVKTDSDARAPYALTPKGRLLLAALQPAK